ncbi:MAG: hypothetical protein KDL87_18700, partial [Verrucomicrobiae bacterium]|nr:hypothetical protein [Verrucomicrobiae bacterium]
MNPRPFFPRFTANPWAFAMIALLSAGPLSAEEALDCRPVVEQLRKNVETAPAHVLTLLEDAIIANGGNCISPFVQTAIEASKADAATVKKIVFVAITSAPKQAPEIAEAAVAASPSNADSVRAAFSEAFDEKNPRMKPADPATKPAWEVANSPVSPPKSTPAPAPIPVPVPAPQPAKTAPANPAPVVAANDENPYINIDDTDPNAGWQLLHDGVIDDAHATASHENTASIVPPPPLEEENPAKKGVFGFHLPQLPSLPPVDQPIDLYFHSPFGGIP